MRELLTFGVLDIINSSSVNVLKITLEYYMK